MNRIAIIKIRKINKKMMKVKSILKKYKQKIQMKKKNFSIKIKMQII